MAQQTSTRITSVRTVAVPVSDQDQAVDFYVGTLGFEKRLDAAFGPGLRWVEVAPPGALTSLALVLAGEGRQVGVDTGIRLTTSDADGDHAHLRSSGVDTDPEVMRMAGGVPPMFSFRDPDGNALYVVEAP
jgi:catechol 2,3-dioxygenase-like lactoylglutathione lyase family enzyme